MVVSLSAQIFVAYYAGNKFHPKTWEYEAIAQNMLKKGDFVYNYRDYGEYRALVSPGYPYLTFAVYKIFGTNHRLMLFIQFIMMTALCFIIYRITWLFFKNIWISFIASLLTAVHPGLIFYSSTMLHQFALYITLFFGSILLLCLCHLKNKWPYFILLGIIGGFAVLTRATFLPVIVLGLILYVIINKTNHTKARVIKAVTALAILLIVNAPWAVRNYLIFEKFIYSQTNIWEQFWVGNNPEATGGHYKADGTIVLDYKPPEMQAELDSSDSEISDNKIFRKYAFKYLREQPAAFVSGVLKKAILFWWFFPQTGILYPKYYLLAYRILYTTLLFFAASGLAICQLKKLWKPIMIFPLLLVFGINAVHALNFVEMRHRWTVEPILMILSSVLIFFLIEKIYNLVKKRHREDINHTFTI